jgi:tetratricopeptide (TPR) repeat protein
VGGRGRLLAILLLAVAPAAGADVIHLKNGGTIQADSWEARGDILVIHQGDGTLQVPRADIERIDRIPVPTSPRAASAPATATAAAAPPAAPEMPAQANPAPALTAEQAETRIEELKRRLRDLPMARAENTRQLVALLNSLGFEAYRHRDFDGSLSRFREAAGFDPHDAPAQLGLAASYLAQGQDLYARSTLEQAVLEHPDNPDLLTLLGDVYDSEERPEEALGAWEKAQSIRPQEAVRRRIDKLRREHAVEGDYRLAEAAHFTLKYDGERAGEDLGDAILSYLEQEFTTLVTTFDYYPRQPIVVIVYPMRQFHEATLAESDVAGLYDGKIRVPIGGLKRLDPEARQVLLHELAHAFIAGKSLGTAPRWLHEGLAQQIEGRTTPRGTAIELARQFRALSDPTAWGTAFTYPSSLSFVEFLIDREGLPHLVDVLQAMGEGLTPDAAFERVTRYSLAEMRQAWGESLVAANLQ